LLFLTGASVPWITFGIGAGAVIFVRHLGEWNR
jgi:hypothetical protein